MSKFIYHIRRYAPLRTIWLLVSGLHADVDSEANHQPYGMYDDRDISEGLEKLCGLLDQIKRLCEEALIVYESLLDEPE